jgi:hypothetical protein
MAPALLLFLTKNYHEAKPRWRDVAAARLASSCSSPPPCLSVFFFFCVDIPPCSPTHGKTWLLAQMALPGQVTNATEQRACLCPGVTRMASASPLCNFKIAVVTRAVDRLSCPGAQTSDQLRASCPVLALDVRDEFALRCLAKHIGGVVVAESVFFSFSRVRPIPGMASR